jgi:diadenosine tetraphosphate (Ap4A) HIT family hydrolase
MNGPLDTTARRAGPLDATDRSCSFVSPRGDNGVASLSPRSASASRPHSVCRLCGIRNSAAHWDRVLLESDHFLVVPSKGGFLPGWLLIVPKHHLLSMAQLDPARSAELDSLTITVSDLVASRFAAPTTFEHGATCPGTIFGCGIDHAHLHVVPLPRRMSLRAIAEEELGERFGRFAPSPLRPYLRVREPSDPTWFTLEPLARPPRQFFRQLIWRATAQPSASYDYDESPCLHQVEKTIAGLVGR